MGESTTPKEMADELEREGLPAGTIIWHLRRKFGNTPEVRKVAKAVAKRHPPAVGDYSQQGQQGDQRGQVTAERAIDERLTALRGLVEVDATLRDLERSYTADRTDATGLRWLRAAVRSGQGLGVWSKLPADLRRQFTENYLKQLHKKVRAGLSNFVQKALPETKVHLVPATEHERTGYFERHTEKTLAEVRHLEVQFSLGEPPGSHTYSPRGDRSWQPDWSVIQQPVIGYFNSLGGTWIHEPYREPRYGPPGYFYFTVYLHVNGMGWNTANAARNIDEEAVRDMVLNTPWPTSLTESDADTRTKERAYRKQPDSASAASAYVSSVLRNGTIPEILDAWTSLDRQLAQPAEARLGAKIVQTLENSVADYIEREIPSTGGHRFRKSPLMKVYVIPDERRFVIDQAGVLRLTAVDYASGVDLVDELRGAVEDFLQEHWRNPQDTHNRWHVGNTANTVQNIQNDDEIIATLHLNINRSLDRWFVELLRDELSKGA